MYQNFVDQQLIIWKNNLEFQHFDILYQQQRSSTEIIKCLHEQAQKLLEEANHLQ